MSNHIETLIKGAQGSEAMFIAAVKGIPEDKRNWSPGGEATTVNWNINHVAHFPVFIKASIEAMAPSFDFNAADLDFDEAIESLRAATADFCEYIKSVPAEKLDQEIEFPWGKYPVSAVLSWHEWNLTYHFGQVSYIQLILGDKEMYV